LHVCKSKHLMPSLGFFFDVHHSPQVNLLKRMLRLDPVMVDEQYKISKERVITDELISLGALTPEQLDVVLRCVRRVRVWCLGVLKRMCMGICAYGTYYSWAKHRRQRNTLAIRAQVNQFIHPLYSFACTKLRSSVPPPPFSLPRARVLSLSPA